MKISFKNADHLLDGIRLLTDDLKLALTDESVDITVKKSTAQGEIFAPPSKSIAHRNLICAFLAKGESEISSLSFSEDIKATINCIKALGGEVELLGDTAKVNGRTLNVCDELFCNESGSTLRFFVPIALLLDKEITF